jgi:DNA repair protein RecO (recombination protein O)
LGLLQGAGFVLRTRDYAESDLIVTLFTESWGKRTAIAKRARRFDSRLGGVFDLLNRVEVVFYEKPRLDLASQGALLDGFPRLKSDLKSISVALAIGRTLDRLLPLHQREDRIYTLFHRFLTLLEEGEVLTEQLSLATWLKLLALLGHRPHLQACARCGERSGTFFFVPAQGGLLCSTCSHGDGIAITRGLALSLHTLASRPLERAGVVRLTTDEIELSHDLTASYTDHLASGP